VVARIALAFEDPVAGALEELPAGVAGNGHETALPAHALPRFDLAAAVLTAFGAA
jgi:hypothetical protein